VLLFDGKFTNAPHVPRGRAFLDSRDMVRNPVDVFEKYRAELGPTFTFHFGGARRSVVSTDPALIQHVLLDNRDNYEKSDIQVERMVEFQGKGLVNSHGEAWFRQRRLVAKGFRQKRLAEVLPIQQDVLGELLVRFDQEAAMGPVDVHKHMVRLTLRLVGKSLFGRSMGEEELEQIGDTITEIQAFIVRQIVQPYKIPWFRISGQSERYQKLRRDADKIVLRHIQERRKDLESDNDFLRILLETPYHDTGEPMGEGMALIESLQLMVAGNETSSNALTWVFYLLARHPEYIKQVRQEIATVIGDDAIDFKNLHQLELTLRVVDEALRLYPPFWMIDRIALEDDEVCGIHIPAGTLVIPYIYGTHRNPEIWTDAESFDPSRFESENRKERHTYGYIPFGGGPRICVGNNMAIMQILMIIVALVRDYDFELATDRPVGIQPMMLLRPEGAIMMKFKRIGT
jgi:cytochrome P450